MKKIELTFLVMYLCLAFATFNSFLYVSPVQPLLVKVTFAFGILLILWRLIRFRNYWKMPGILLMILFCGSFLFSAWMNRQYALTENLKWVAWTGILFFAIYARDAEQDSAACRKEFQIISHIVIAYTSIAAAVSLAMLWTSYFQILVSADGETTTAGLTWGRLWGVYTDPNYGAVISVVSILLCMLFVQQSRILLRGIYGVCMLLNFLYIIFSDSRTGRIALVCGIVCCLFLWLFQKQNGYPNRRRTILSLAAAVGVGALVLGGSFAIEKIGKPLTTQTAQTTTQQDQTTQTTTQQDKTTQSTTQQDKTSQSKPAVGRDADIARDVSNGRLALWQSAVEIWKSSPVYGVGYSSLVEYCEDNLPDTYAVNNSQTAYTSMHNAFFNVLVFQGSIGAAIYLLLVVRILSYSLPRVFRTRGENYQDLAAMLGSILTIGISMLFLLEGTYTNSPGSFVLWVFAGYMVQMVRSEETVAALEETAA